MVHVFTPDDVLTLVGSTTFERGMDYARSGMVQGAARSAKRHTIVGHVVGSARNNYVVTIMTTTGSGPDGPRLIFGQCTCPVRMNCKHVAATLLTYIDNEAVKSGAAPLVTPDSPVQEMSEWERILAPVLEPQAHAFDDRHPRGPGQLGKREAQGEVALLFELQPGVGAAKAQSMGPYGRVVPPQLGMRPVTRGKSGRWVRTGVTWRDLSQWDGSFRQDHLEVLRALYALSGEGTDSYYYGGTTAWIYLDKMHSTAAWALLHDARRMALPLVQSDAAQSEVRLSPTPVTARLELFRDNGILHAQPVLSLEGEILDPAGIAFVGKPATGIYSSSGVKSAALKERRLLLAPLAKPLGKAEQGLLKRPGSLTITSEDENRFLSQVVDAIRDRIEVVAIDDDVVMPDVPEPSLWLVIDRRPDHEITMSWQFRYGPGAQAPWAMTMTIGQEPSSATTRDEAAEAALLDRVTPQSGRLARLLRVAATGVSVASQYPLTGLATAKFMTDELPALLALAEDVERFSVELTGDGAGVEYVREENVGIEVSTTPNEDKRDWFDLGIMITAGDRKIPFVDVFSALATGQTEVLLPSGLHFTLDDDRFGRLRELITEARALQDTMGGPLRVNRFQAGLFEDLEGLGVLDVQAQAWRDALGALADADKRPDVPAPAGLHATMREYQLEGYQWLSFLAENQLGGVLADDMGLGKTIQGLALIQRTFETTPAAERKPYLVVAPTSVVGNWASETRKFTPDLTVATIHETEARRRVPLAEAIAGADVVVTSYALFRIEFEAYNEIEWAGLILDEAQFVKNHQSVAYQCARRLNTPVKIAMTGTPFENHLMELWSIISIVSPGLFPHPGRFAEYYQRPIEKGHDGERLDQLRRRITPFMMRRTKEEVAKDLPAKQEQVVDVVLKPKHRVVYDQYLQRERTKVLGLVDDMDSHRFEVFRSLTVLRQAALDVSLVDDEHEGLPSSKLDVLFELLDDVVAEGHSVLIFSQFTRYLGKVRDRLDKRGLDYSYLDGRTKKRTETIERFTSGETKVFLISLKAGGFGLNLTAADYCILLDPWWNPAAEAQAVDRAHRIGQERNVMVYRLVASDTIEEKVMELKAAKSALFANVLAAEVDGAPVGRSVSNAGITASDIRDLLG